MSEQVWRRGIVYEEEAGFSAHDYDVLFLGGGQKCRSFDGFEQAMKTSIVLLSFCVTCRSNNADLRIMAHKISTDCE
jgi:hypothetical protein